MPTLLWWVDESHKKTDIIIYFPNNSPQRKCVQSSRSYVNVNFVIKIKHRRVVNKNFILNLNAKCWYSIENCKHHNVIGYKLLTLLCELFLLHIISWFMTVAWYVLWRKKLKTLKKGAIFGRGNSPKKDENNSKKVYLLLCYFSILGHFADTFSLIRKKCTLVIQLDNQLP